MRLFHTSPVTSAVLDKPNLVSFAGLVPLMALLADVQGMFTNDIVGPPARGPGGRRHLGHA
jgi:hypothetical protein